MEKQKLENKLYKDFTQGYATIIGGLSSSISEAENALTKNMDEKEKKRFLAYMKKRVALLQVSNNKAIKDLDRAYNGK